MTERTVSFGANSETWMTELRRARLRRATSPVSGLTRPARISISVDLPEPLGPMSPMRSPSETVNEMFWNRGATPYLFDSPWALMIGGKFLGLLLNLVYP